MDNNNYYESAEADFALAGPDALNGQDDAKSEAERVLAAESDIPWRGMISPPSSGPPVAGVLHGGEGDWQGGARFWNQDDPLDSFKAAFGGESFEDGDEAGAPDAIGAPDATGDEPARSELVLGVKLSQYGPVYFFKAGQEKLKPGDKVLADAEQGVSLAEVVIARRLRPPLPKIRTEDGQEVDIRPIRGLAGPADIAAAADNRIMAASARLFCKECIRERNLDMKLVDVEVLHDRSKIIFYFTAPTRIDFRELVKDLVRNYHTRIELRQIGVRHETQMLGALGNCGMTCCCRRYLRKFAPVTIKMAKEQNLFLNPAKLSGICGRLLCCLSYEQANYEEFHKRSPKIGKKYRTRQGMVKILRANLFRQSLFIQDEAGQEIELQLEDWEALQPVRLEQGGQEGGEQERGPALPAPESLMPALPIEDLPPAPGEQQPDHPGERQHKAAPDKPAGTMPASEDLRPMRSEGAAFLPATAEALPAALPVAGEAAAGEDQSIFGLPGSRYAGQPDKSDKPDRPGRNRGRWRKHNKNR